MRNRTLGLCTALAVLAGACTDHRPAPTAHDTVHTADPATEIAAAGAIQPSPSDRILFDARGSLQQATTLGDALRLFGINAETRQRWAFTTNMDGAGTNALRVDWRAWSGSRCTPIAANLPYTFPTPYPAAVYVQWKQRLGRTATGGGLGTIGSFQVHNSACGNGGRTVWRVLRDNAGATAHGRAAVIWPGPQPVEPKVSVHGYSITAAGNQGWSHRPQDNVGKAVEYTVFLRAATSPDARDGVIRLWVDGRLLVERTDLALGADAFRRFNFPTVFLAPARAQSEYFWDIVAWAPGTQQTPVASVVVTPPAATIAAGATVQLTAEARDAAGNPLPGRPMAWTTSNSTVASVSSTGLVTGLNAGTANIAATSEGKADTSVVTVTASSEPRLVAVELTPPSVTLQTGTSQQFAAVGRMSDGTTRQITVTYAATGGTITTAGLYTAGSTAGAFRATATESGGLADTSAITITSTPPPSGTPDLSVLPVANRQLPAFQSYTGRSTAAGASYTDPVSGVRIWRMTGPSTPGAGGSGQHDYSGGPVQISREWGNGQHTMVTFQGGSHYLVDFRRGVGFSNWRAFPNTSFQLSFTFSQNPATPRIAYYLNGTSLRRYNTATGQDENTGNFPHSFAAQTGGTITWLQQDKNDEWFVMMPTNASQVIAWNSRTNQTLTRSIATLDEPHFEKDGRYVVLVNDGAVNMYTWDLQTNSMTGNAGRYGVHVDGVRSYFQAVDPDLGTAPQFYHDPATNRTVETLTAHEMSSELQHRGGQWVQTDAELGGNLLKQWLIWSGYNDGPVSQSGWTLVGGQVYSATVSFLYEQAVPGIQSVRQFVAGDNTQVARQLTRVASQAALVEGSFYYDAGPRRVYVWAVGGGSPANRVTPRAPSKAHDAIAFMRLDGSDVRLLAHHYSVNPVYDAAPKATVSPDGKIVMFSSNMNDSNGRHDVFVIEVPLR